jgi:hypothetical protein
MKMNAMRSGSIKHQIYINVLHSALVLDLLRGLSLMLLGLEFNNKKNEYMIECWLNPSNSILPTSSNQYHASNHLVGHFFEKINKNQQKSNFLKTPL